MKLVNKTKNKEILSSLKQAETFLSKAIGLLNKQGLEKGEGLLFTNCGSIHTLGMRFSIDVIFLDAGNRVVKTVSCLKPMRLCFGPFKTKYIIESFCGAFKGRADKGDILVWEE